MASVPSDVALAGKGVIAEKIELSAANAHTESGDRQAEAEAYRD